MAETYGFDRATMTALCVAFVRANAARERVAFEAMTPEFQMHVKRAVVAMVRVLAPAMHQPPPEQPIFTVTLA
jgi:hypothetical protein